ncbi:hypothetical protein B0A49_08117 [Cryomyces minteri]|uniref:NAD(P)-binding domain-containing protein n=1 Tax=Cryomyces minteri TaxID=331657 RepID=A0A4V5NE61_9PEZI|nr:hypothetical protein B0A49_08117 [Cryomyces minteri]
MATYALLGATGSTGSAILRYLLEEPPQRLKLKIFVRSKSKLLKAFPDIEDKAPFSVDIIEGTPDDSAALQKCLQGANVVFMCIATNQCIRGLSICYDITTSIIAALKVLRQKQASSYAVPTILQLRSVNSNPTLGPKESFIARSILRYCLSYVYADLDRGCELLEKTATEDPALLDYVFVDPPGLHDSNGTTRTGHELLVTELPKMNLSYADLGAGFCEVAERRNEFKGMGVAVSATGPVNLSSSILLGYVVTGLKARWIG